MANALGRPPFLERIFVEARRFDRVGSSTKPHEEGGWTCGRGGANRGAAPAEGVQIDVLYSIVLYDIV